MSHANAALTPRHRLKVAQLVVDQGYRISEVAARFRVSWPTVKRWVDRYVAGESMADRSSRPRRQPLRTPPQVVRRVLELRWRKRLGPLQLSARTGVAASTVHKILARNRLNYVDRATGEPVRRYEHDHAGSLIHVDVKKLGNIPEGGWRFVGHSTGKKNRASTVPERRQGKTRGPLLGYAFVHKPLGAYPSGVVCQLALVREVVVEVEASQVFATTGRALLGWFGRARRCRWNRAESSSRPVP